MMEWFREKFILLESLTDAEAKKDNLAEIKIKLTSFTSEELKQVATDLDLSLIFSELTSNDKEIMMQACDVLDTLFDATEPGRIHRRYSDEMKSSMSLQQSTVKILILRELLRIASKPENIHSLISDTDLLMVIVDKVADEDIAVAKLAMDVLKEIGSSNEGLKVFYAGPIMRMFARMLSKNDTISFRIYETVVNISKSSKEGLEASINSGFLSSLITVLENDDILLQLNALEIMTDLALTPEGLDFLEHQDILCKLSEKIERANENPLSTILIPGLMKFFGNVACVRPNEIFSNYPTVVSALFEVLESDDPTILSGALDTLGHVASTVEGKYALQTLGEPIFNALKRVAEVIQRMPTEIRIRGLNNLALILQVKREEQDNRILSLTKSWFDSLKDNPLDMIVSLCKQPFADIRQASLEVLAVIASQAWGQEYIAVQPGLIEFLLDRNVEAFKECKEAKYEVVKTLSQSVADIFDAHTIQRMKQFIKEGPLYRDTNTEVATEGAS
ncbi:26S proteasome non-ATPase regulatory subunit 5 [Cephus cinctus]|uniref:26S proteasome non-ATPase regulatory subunit 5 n=1 Tax=Cephus cinctus TaxID=211228 RepID=A0AAJ7BYW3_CEPCN|nr:26S proteasome non-ATPase regulatory subunit 5 [Cephus cinctus]